MSYEGVKSVAKAVGLYRSARWVNRHVLNRPELEEFRRDVAFYRSLLPAGALCFDVGANYGAKTEVLLQAGARVVAFEPQIDCLEELQSRMGANPRLTTLRAAVGSAEGTLTMYVGKHRTTSTLVKGWETADVVDTVEVNVTTLDVAIGRFGVPDYVKIDVEGFEQEVLGGLTQRVPLVSFEYHLRGDGVARALACLDRLATLGTATVNVTPSERLAFAGDTWRTHRDFVTFFRDTLPSMAGYHYGDIFVRLS